MHHPALKRKQIIRIKKLKQNQVRRALEKMQNLQNLKGLDDLPFDTVTDIGGTMLNSIKMGANFKTWATRLQFPIEMANGELTHQGKKPIKETELKALYEKMAQNFKKRHNA